MDMTQWADAGLMPSHEAMWDHLLIGLLQRGIQNPPDYPDRLAEAGIAFQGDWFGLIELQVVAVDAYTYIQGLGQTAYSEAELVVHILELFRQQLKEQPGAFVFKVQSEILCILCGEDRAAVEQKLRELAEALVSLEQRVRGIRLFAAISTVEETLESLKDAKEQVRQLFEYRAFHLRTEPILEPSLLSCRETPERTDIVKEQEILTLFKSGQYRQAMDCFGRLFDEEYLALANPLILLKHKCVQYLDSLMNVASEIIGSRPDFGTDFPEHRILAAGTYPEVRAQMEHTLGQLNDMVLAGKDCGMGWIVDIKNYIRGHYNDPNLNVNTLAEAFSKNASYLSRSFLKQTGTSILQYIHHYRIQEAKILIGRGVTLAVAAEAVGYSNVLTMSRAFKKYEGTTPGKLRG